MVGIAAGIRGKCNVGDPVIVDPSWNYESGKVLGTSSGSIFLPEPHQLHLDVDLRERFKVLIEDASLAAQIKAEWRGPAPSHELRMRVGPLGSGSAVLADSERVGKIGEQHRKVLGIDMEAYSIFAAAAEATVPRPTAFCIKSICDFADELKDDSFQSYAAYTSAETLRHFVEVQMLESPT